MWERRCWNRRRTSPGQSGPLEERDGCTTDRHSTDLPNFWIETRYGVLKFYQTGVHKLKPLTIPTVKLLTLPFATSAETNESIL